MPISPQITITPETIDTKNFDISAVSFTSSTATYTATGHTFVIGENVLISGLAPDGYNGNFTVTGVTTNTFTVSNSTNAAVTDAVGNAFSTDSNEFEFENFDAAYVTDNNDVDDLINSNPSLAQALADAADALANAATANANATTAVLQAGVAQSTANGKNKVTYSAASPSGGGANGDIWFQLNGSNNVTAQYLYNGSSWISAPITSAVIANLDAAKITSGQITSISINNGSGTFSVSPAGALVASSANITGTINATSGTFTGTVNAATGSIGGWTINGTSLFSGSSYMSASTGNAVFSDLTGYSINASTDVYAGTSVESGTFIRANGALYAAGHTTTGSAANGYVNPSTGLIARSTASSRRYKHDIVNLVDVPELNPEKLYDLPVRAFRFNEGYIPESDDRAGVLVPGFIAEEMDEIYPLGADYVEGRGVETWNDRMITPALLALIQSQNKRLIALETQLANLTTNS